MKKARTDRSQMRVIKHRTGRAVVLACMLVYLAVLAGCDTRERERIIAFSSDRDGNWDIYLVNADGSQLTRVVDSQSNDTDPDWDPHGEHIVFVSDRDGDNNIHSLDLRSDKVTQLTDAPGDDLAPVWSPTGKAIAFMSDRAGNWDIYVVDTETRDVAQITDNEAADVSPEWTRDGTHLLFASDRRDPQTRLLMLFSVEAKGGEAVELFPGSTSRLSQPRLCPTDPNRILATHVTPGLEVVHINLSQFDPTGRPSLVMHEPSWSPSWSPDCDGIAYVSPIATGQQIFVVRADDFTSSDACCQGISTQITSEGNNDNPVWKPQ